MSKARWVLILAVLLGLLAFAPVALAAGCTTLYQDTGISLGVCEGGGYSVSVPPGGTVTIATWTPTATPTATNTPTQTPTPIPQIALDPGEQRILTCPSSLTVAQGVTDDGEYVRVGCPLATATPTETMTSTPTVTPTVTMTSSATATPTPPATFPPDPTPSTTMEPTGTATVIALGGGHVAITPGPAQLVVLATAPNGREDDTARAQAVRVDPDDTASCALVGTPTPIITRLTCNPVWTSPVALVAAGDGTRRGVIASLTPEADYEAEVIWTKPGDTEMVTMPAEVYQTGGTP